MFLKYLIAGCTLLVLVGTESINAAPQGFLEGHLKIISPREVEPSDEMPRQTVTAETYAQYPLIILSAGAQKEIARVTADENGNYRVALPPGAYVPDLEGRTQGHTRGHIRAKPQRFTVASDQTVRVDVTIDRDHWRARSPQSFRPD